MELIRHLLTENCLPHLQCRARLLPGSVAARRPMIRGLINIDFQLPKRTQDTTLQECIICWHEQKIPHGLLYAPAFLLVTLARYTNVARGKNRTRVPCKAMQRASFPVFSGSDHAVQWDLTPWVDAPARALQNLRGIPVARLGSWPIHGLRLVLPCRS